VLLRLTALFVLVPLAELALLVWLGGKVGLLPTVALVVVTGILGASLARQQGLASWRRFQQALAEGRPPHRELLEGLLVLLAGAVLLTPGLLTDLTGFALLTPPLRNVIKGVLRRWARKNIEVRTTQTASQFWSSEPTPQYRDEIIDAEVVETRVVD